MNATEVLDLLVLGRALQEAGRCQGPFAAILDDGDLYEVDIQSPDATHYCAAGAFYFAGLELGVTPNRYEWQTARHLLSEAAREFLKRQTLTDFWQRVLADDHCQTNFAILANDRMELTDAEMLSIWDDAAAMVNPK